MKLNTKVKVNLMSDVCADTSVADIGNGFFKVSRTAINVTLVGFDDDLSKKSIPIEAASTDIDLQNVTIIDQINKTPLLHGGDIYLI